MGSRDMTETPQERDTRRVKELVLEVQSTAYGYAMTYTAIIIFGGYAALFTVWTHTKEYLNATTTMWVALLLGVSVLCFVMFEVFKMILTSIEFMKVRSLLVVDYPPAILLEKRAQLARQQNVTVQRIVVPIWIVVLIITIVSGFGAAFILLASFISFLSSGAPAST